jgi:hypothetical protein
MVEGLLNADVIMIIKIPFPHNTLFDKYTMVVERDIATDFPDVMSSEILRGKEQVYHGR